jgi:SAM-dependent methyltransferase
MDAYDAIPYDSHSFPETHPEYLAALARLFGVEAPDPLRCRVLELGCAAGGNLLPLAWYLPDSHCVGVELSATQGQDGQQQIQALGLRNCRILTGDAAELELGNEGFDYIIAQGLYSWVPAATRAGLLAQIRCQLRPGGVAYVSFNALPGWRMRGMLRDMLRYHIQDETSPRERLAAARELFPFLQACLEGLDALSARYLRHELAQLTAAADSYLYHEFLSEVNEPQLFTQFVAEAEAQGLRWLCNAELQYQLPAILGEQAQARLGAIPDPLERQQYLDFILSRNFHQALLEIGRAHV